ncbi:MAG: 3-hydroxyacyl-CoA dehydrogenase family protein [Actinomycetota bacterium]
MKVAVLGAGIMGSGIAQLSAMAGHDVAVRDIDDPALDRGRKAVEFSLGKLVEKGRMAEEEADAVRGRLTWTTDLAGSVTDVDVVVEAVPEVLALKQEVLTAAVAAAPADALIGTNTSQLSITSIGAALGDAADRLVGMHFFNPPVLMKLCELVRGLATGDEALQRARSFAEGLGKTVVVCRKDSPGFITSRAYAILRMECLRMLEEGVATAEDIDTAMKLGFNFPMGPLELGDFNGLDTYLHAVESLAEAHGDRFRPTVGLRNMVAAGHLGRKAGKGFYDYDEG